MLALEVAAANAGKAAAHERGLSDMQRDRLEDLLRGLSAERDSICEVGAGAEGAQGRGWLTGWCVAALPGVLSSQLAASTRGDKSQDMLLS